MKNVKRSLFGDVKGVVGMVHVGALPGTAGHGETLSEIEQKAVAEARVYKEAGVQGVMLENMHDTPYLRGRVGPEIVACMAVVCRAVREEVGSGVKVGVQILAGANLEAVAVAHAAGLDFVRAEGFAFAHVADEGIIESSAAELLRFRKMIGAERVQVWTDVKKKHSSHAITADIGIGETAHAVEFMRGDAVIVTGSVTGDAPRALDVREVKGKCGLPVYLGSGVTKENLGEFWEGADGFIVGSYFKVGGFWGNALDRGRVEGFMEAWRGFNDEARMTNEI